MEFRLQWLPPFDEASPEGVTFADWALYVSGRAATELEDLNARTLRDSALVSVYPLAMFLAANWWRLRWEPGSANPSAEWRLRHGLAAVGEGYAWPDITFASDGESVCVEIGAGQPFSVAPVRYLANFTAWLPAAAFEEAVDEFLELVSGRLRAMGAAEDELLDLWKEVRHERRDADLARWRRLEALAGFDPDEAPQEFMTRLLQAGEETGSLALEELAASSRAHALDDLHAVRQALEGRGAHFQVAELNDLRDSVAPWLGGAASAPWQRAACAARQAREHWRLDDAPVSNGRLREICGLPQGLIEADAVPTDSPYSASIHPDDEASGHIILNRRPVTSRRFAVCRLLGDRLYSTITGGDPLSTATDAYTVRQKFQRAFAQELLCPFDSLMGLLDTDSPSDEDIEGAADHFQVSPLLVRTALVNRHVLPREALGQFG
ncbi:MAG: hypothetical protein FKY71_04765 [Spiribacter salinus]|uniref:Uncharacterized protein n=1 Tax=Spiribacter salinus TaxID=1335746 RepID=A0A540VTS8_9GAMM|nr:MAG: hypothetical protein FKY71_04765 [Spiribacter salinus]